MSIIEYFFLNEPQFSTAIYTLLYLLLSAVIGFALRSYQIVGVAWGFLILSASADLATFISRSTELSTAYFGPVVLLIVIAIVLLLRISYFFQHTVKKQIDKAYLIVLVFFGTMIWAGNILHPYPDAGFSSHHGWVPLYIQESFSMGRFINIEDMAFGEGVMTALFYPADLLGLVALSAWFGESEVYPAFNAGSITATLLMFGVLAQSLRENSVSLVLFLILTMVMFYHDPFFRTVLGGNWGDVLLYLGGALVCFYLGRSVEDKYALILAALASLFLVFGRHYGAFYSAIIVTICLFISWLDSRKIELKPWLIIGSLWGTFSFRELYYLFGDFTKYYPGSWQAERHLLSLEDHLLGAFTDWGLIDGAALSSINISIRALYFIVLVFTLWKLFPQIKSNKLLIVCMLSPLIVLLAPLILQIVTGYRTNESYSKLYILGVFFFAWYPCFLLNRLEIYKEGFSIRRRLKKRVLVLGSFLFLSLGVIFFQYAKLDNVFAYDLKSSLKNLFDDKIVDREIVTQLRKELSDSDLEDLINRPIMYVYFEPGTSIRLYLGGEFFKDLDFWSVPVGKEAELASSMSDLLDRLNYPNIYIGLTSNGKISGYPDSIRKYLIEELENADKKPWLKKMISYGTARFYIVNTLDN